MPSPKIATLEGDHVWSEYSLECDAELVATFVGECQVEKDKTSEMQLDHIHDDIMSCNYVVRIKVPDEAPMRIVTWGKVNPNGMSIHCYPDDKPDQFRLLKESLSFDLTEDDQRDGEISAPISQKDLIDMGECWINGNLKLVYLEGENLNKPTTRFNESYQIKIKRPPNDD